MGSGWRECAGEQARRGDRIDLTACAESFETQETTGFLCANAADLWRRLGEKSAVEEFRYRRKGIATVLNIKMSVYADTSFLVAVYSSEAGSVQALRWMGRQKSALIFTPLHRHELRTAIRLKEFRGEITEQQRNAAFEEIESDLEEGVLAHFPISWTEAFRECERLGEQHCASLGVRSLDLLHVGTALSVKAKEFVTFDVRQRELAVAAGLKVLFQGL